MEPDWERIARELNDNVVHPILVGGNHLATHAVLRKWPDWWSDSEAVLERLGAGLEYDAWCCWSAIMKAANARRQINICDKAISA